MGFVALELATLGTAKRAVCAKQRVGTAPPLKGPLAGAHSGHVPTRGAAAAPAAAAAAAAPRRLLISGRRLGGRPGRRVGVAHLTVGTAHSSTADFPTRTRSRTRDDLLLRLLTTFKLSLRLRERTTV